MPRSWLLLDYTSTSPRHHPAVAGAGKECCYSPKNLNAVLNPGPPLFRMDRDQNYGAIGGFASYVVTAQNTTIRYHSDNGTVLYTGTPVKPRNL